MFCCPPSLPVTAMTSRFSLLHGYTASFIRVEPITTQRRCELTPYSQRAHLNYLTVGSFLDTQLAQSELSRSAHTVGLLWAFCEFATLTVSSLLPLHGELIRCSHLLLKASSPCEFQTHRKLTACSQCKSSCEFTLRQLSVLKMSFP